MQDYDDKDLAMVSIALITIVYIVCCVIWENGEPKDVILPAVTAICAMATGRTKNGNGNG